MFALKKAVLYCRYSSNRQTECSIEGQVRECTEFALEHGLAIVGKYIDRSRSGRDMGRHELQRLLKESRKGEWSVVLVWKLDRLSRSQEDYFLIIRMLGQNGVAVMSATERFSGDISDILLKGLLVSLSQYYSAELGEKVKRGMRTGFLKGHVMGGNLTYGYRRVGHSFSLDEERAKVVKTAFLTYADNESLSIKGLKEIINALPEVKAEGRRFNESSLHRMLVNARYAGENTLFGETRTEDIPSIVSDEVFEKVREKLRRKRINTQKKKEN